MFSSIRKSFREHVVGRNSRRNEVTLTSRELSVAESRRNANEDYKVGTRSAYKNARSPKETTGKVAKRRVSGSMSKSRLDLLTAAVDSHLARPKLSAVTEAELDIIKEDDLIERHKNHVPSRFRSSDEHVSHSGLLRLSAPELVKEIIYLRSENSNLKKDSVTKDQIAAKVTADEQQADVLDKANSQLQVLREELNRERLKTKEVERSKNRLMKQVALTKKIEGSMYDDAHFKEEVQQLRWQVYNWVKNRKWRLMTGSKSRHHNKDYRFLEKICPEYQDYISSKKGMEMLIQAHIWQYIAREIFARCFWAETRDLSEAAHDINNNPFSVLKGQLLQAGEIAVRGRNAEFQQWRVASARLLSKCSLKTIHSNIAHAAKELVSRFSIDFEPIISGNMQVSVPVLEAIFLSAINLDFIVQQHRANYVFFPVLPETTDWHHSYDGEKMIVIDEDFTMSNNQEPLEVELIVEPGFYKFGDAQGQNYNVCSYLLKAEVELRSYGSR